jgi:hypothetical protein
MHATRNSPAFKAAARMPLLDHFHRGRPFDIAESDVVAWLIAQPEIQQETFNWCKLNGAIVYDDGKWRGVDFVTRFRFLNSEQFGTIRVNNASICLNPQPQQSSQQWAQLHPRFSPQFYRHSFVGCAKALFQSRYRHAG